jgi:hypothetical protein
MARDVVLGLGLCGTNAHMKRCCEINAHINATLVKEMVGDTRKRGWGF